MMLTDGQIIGTYEDRLLGARESAMAWGRESRKGLRCGVLGCSARGSAMRLIRCPVCYYCYCEGHMVVHPHFVGQKRSKIRRLLCRLGLSTADIEALTSDVWTGGKE